MAGRKRKLTKEQQLEFIDWWVNRMRLCDWERKFGVSRQCLQDTLVRHGIKKPCPSDIPRVKIYRTERAHAGLGIRAAARRETATGRPGTREVTRVTDSVTTSYQGVER